MSAVPREPYPFYHQRPVAEARAASRVPSAQSSLVRTTARVFTTGQVAHLLGVAPRTVSKWFDRGLLSGYRIPGSNDRRIPREDLLKFIAEHGLPMPLELSRP